MYQSVGFITTCCYLFALRPNTFHLSSLYTYLLCTLLSLTASDDFVAQTSVQVTFDSNSAWQTVDVQLLSDNILESTEYFVGMISSMQRGVLINQNTMSVNVADDDSELSLIDHIFRSVALSYNMYVDVSSYNTPLTSHPTFEST